MDINERNSIRAAAGLPLLDIDAEKKRVAAVREQAEFEREWLRRQPEFAHQWTGNRDGWMANMGRWCHARRQVRDQMRKD